MQCNYAVELLCEQGVCTYFLGLLAESSRNLEFAIGTDISYSILSCFRRVLVMPKVLENIYNYAVELSCKQCVCTL